MIVFLDSGVLGLATSPSKSGEARKCKQWLYQLLVRGAYVVSSDICDYEVRRGLLLASETQKLGEGVQQLDALDELVDFLAVTKPVLLKAARIWSQARIQGMPTADIKNIDADMIICAQFELLQETYPGQYIVIATTNVKHLGRFAEARTWKDINF